MLRQSLASPLRSLYAGSAARTMLRQQVGQQVRMNSTVNTIVAKANGVVSLAKTAADETLYWSKVIAEVAKQVYLKEGLAPPSVETFKSTYLSFSQKFLSKLASPEAVIDSAKSIDRQTVYRYTAYGVQIVGFFSLGEVIGRRKLVGY
ncbi:mitochondrial ATP synthase g subunit-domain-containing protein [Myxozyma melibiosi]|uniref:Mitochondrial ATP synthase g subunit-domain-containing protein n=1 Tax=Myxozyma melibiosi TaxID=54550 RepID=A0ABR1F0V0_9ASCO